MAAGTEVDLLRAGAANGRDLSRAAGLVSAWPPPSLEEKRSAMEQVLQSSAFVRAGQLRSFLGYICGMELQGRAAELSEYLVGIEALGRPPGYSTADDSSVRRRAHALRQKLEDTYATELAAAPVRIDLPKGGYVPRFVRVDTRAPAEEKPAEAVSGAPAPTAEASTQPYGRARIAAVMAASAVLGAALTAMAALAVGSSRSRGDLIVGEAWGPLAEPGSNPLICLATAPHIGVLPYPEGPLPPGVTPAPDDPSLREWYRRNYPLLPGDRLAMHRTTGPVRLGEVMGLLAAVRTLDRLGVSFQTVVEKNVALPALRGRNLLFLGNPETSAAAAKLLERAVLTVAYDPARRDRVVRASRPSPGGEQVYVPKRGPDDELTEVFGLITVLPADAALVTGPSRTVVVSCTNSAGCQAAMEFFASPRSLAALRGRFRAEGRPGFPPAYQVVIRSRVQNAQAVSSDYEAHVVLD